MIPTEDVKQALREVYRRQKYIVIGQPPNASIPFRIGSVTTWLFQYDLGAEFEIYETANQEDWNKQNDLIAELRPTWTRFPNGIGGYFWKLKPVAKKRQLTA